MNIKVMLVIVAVMCLLAACVTPDEWPPETHIKMARACSAACNDDMLSYTPLTGKCVCISKDHKGD